MTAEVIREKYPNPRVLVETYEYEEDVEGYCVGGAFFHYCHVPGHDEVYPPSYPTDDVLAEGLRWANPALSEGMALSFAEGITYLNDRAEFEEAWEELDEALSWKEGL